MLDKVMAFLKLILQYKLLRYGLLFMMLCLGVLMLGAKKVSFFGISVETDSEINRHYDEYEHEDDQEEEYGPQQLKK